MDAEKILQAGRTVIEIEANMIRSLLDKIDQNFANACMLLHQCEGRIVVLGMGKSGHIGRKIAATFASTGSPAFFVHPSEAKHGDMGMITKKDVILALSNSGESEELLALLPFIKRLAIPLIALTGKPSSTLAQAATIHLDVGVKQEACPLGLAPTASTTAALAMGDALAMATLEKRGFQAEDFALSHPGGTLGRRLLLRVEALMHKNESIPLIPLKATLKDALVEMTKKKLGLTLITDTYGKLAGIFTDGDVRRAFDQNATLGDPIEKMMSIHSKCVTPTMLAAEAFAIMEKLKITSLVVMEQDKKPIGVIHLHDILQAGVV